MRRVFLALLALLLTAPVAATWTTAAAAQQDDELRVLVFSRTTGFRHVSIEEGIAAFQRMGAEHGFEVEATEDPDAFTDDNLARFDVVAFLNTTGDPVEDDGQAAFERWMRAGGGWVGIHSAADTEYEWPFYGLLLGQAWFLAHPVQQPGTFVNEAPDEPATAHLPARWTLVDEFYSFQENPRENVRVLLSIDESTYQPDPNTTCLTALEQMDPQYPCPESGVMGDHPMSWCVNIDAGRGFYTALGHENYLYRTPEYLDHLWGGIQTAAKLVEADCGPVLSGDATEVADTAAADPGDVEPEQLPAPEPAPAEPLPATGAGGLAALGLVGALAGWSARRRGGTSAQ